MTTLIAGASGATGRLLTQQLLDRGENVRVIVRSPDSLPEAIRSHPNLSVIHASLLEISAAELAQHVSGCTAVASCLGHNLTFKGMYGHPRQLVTEAVRRLCAAIKTNHPAQPVKVVLMNTAGSSNRDLAEPLSFSQQVVVGLIRRLLPPHADNEQAADYLRVQVGQADALIQWVVVRPDNLVDQPDVTPYTLHTSPTKNAIFAPGTTSRINVAHFMAELITTDDLWHTWKGQMPVIYNQSQA